MSTAPALANAPARLKVGMVVLDRQGAKVGVIADTNLKEAERPAVDVLVSGGTIKEPDSAFAPARDPDEVIVERTPSEIRTETILQNG